MHVPIATIYVAIAVCRAGVGSHAAPTSLLTTTKADLASVAPMDTKTNSANCTQNANRFLMENLAGVSIANDIMSKLDDKKYLDEVMATVRSRDRGDTHFAEWLKDEKAVADKVNRAIFFQDNKDIALAFNNYRNKMRKNKINQVMHNVYDEKDPQIVLQNWRDVFTKYVEDQVTLTKLKEAMEQLNSEEKKKFFVAPLMYNGFLKKEVKKAEEVFESITKLKKEVEKAEEVFKSITELEKEVEKAEEVFKSITELEKEVEKAEEVFKSITKLKKEVEKAEEVFKSITELEKEVEKAEEVFKSITELEKEVEKAEEVFKSITKLKKEVEKAEEVSKSITELEKEVEKAEEVFKSITELEKEVEKAEEVFKSITELEKEVEKAEEVFKSITKLKKEVEKAEEVSKSITKLKNLMK